MKMRLKRVINVVLALSLALGMFTTPVEAANTMEDTFKEIGYPNMLYQSSSAEYVSSMTAYERSFSLKSVAEVYGCIISYDKCPMKIEVLRDGTSIFSQEMYESDWEASSTAYIMNIKMDPSISGTGFYTMRFTFYKDMQFLFYMGQADEETAIAVPSVKVKSIKQTSSGVSYTGELESYPEGIDGVEYEVYTKGGKKVYNSLTWSESIIIYRTNEKRIYYVRARAYSHDEKYNKVYSKWSPKKYFISSPSINASATRKTLKKNSVTLKWDKVTGATKYKVYCSTKSDSGYKLIGTTTKTSLKVTKFRGKRISFSNKKYFKIVSYTTINGKTIKSTPFECIYCQYN